MSLPSSTDLLANHHLLGLQRVAYCLLIILPELVVWQREPAWMRAVTRVSPVDNERAPV